MTDEELTLAMAELQEVVRCRCDEAYRDRGLKDPHCECDSADAVKVVADRIKDLTAKLAKAVEALRNCPPTSNPTISAQEHVDRINAWWRLEARATLAEIKGESQDGMV